MHKQEVDSATLTAGIALPIAGWVGGAYLAQMPFTPFPGAFRETLHQTLQNPIMAGCTVATSVVAGALVYYLNEYCDDGFRGERFIEHLRGSRMRNWHYVDSKVRRRNA